MITLYSILLTVSAYLFTRFLGKKYSSPLTSPVFLSTLIIIFLLVVSNISFDEYRPAKMIMTYLLGPATVALAVPIYKNRNMFKKYFLGSFGRVVNWNCYHHYICHNISQVDEPF